MFIKKASEIDKAENNLSVQLTNILN